MNKSKLENDKRNKQLRKFFFIICSRRAWVNVQFNVFKQQNIRPVETDFKTVTGSKCQVENRELYELTDTASTRPNNQLEF